MKKKKKEKEEQKLPFMKQYNTLQNVTYVMLGSFRYDYGLAVLMFINIVATTVTRYIWAYLSKVVIETVEKPDGTLTKLAINISVAAVLIFLSNFANNYSNEHKMWRMIRARMNFCYIRIKKALKMDYENFENPDVLDLMYKANEATGGNQNGVEGMMWDFYNFMSNLIIILTGGTLIFSVNPWVIFYYVILSFVNFALTDRVNAYTKKNVWDKLSPFWRKKDYFEWNSIDDKAAKDVRIYSMKNWLLKRFTDVNDKMHEIKKLNYKMWSIQTVIAQVIFLLHNFILYGWLIYEVIYRNMAISDFILYVTVVGTFGGSMYNLFQSVVSMMGKNREINDFRSFVELPEKLNRENFVPIPKSKTYKIEFKQVSFKYLKSDKYALKNLSLTLEYGDKLAIVGLNGAGKTTFVKLLSGLYQPTEGEILLNDVNINNYDREEYFSLFSTLFQDISLFMFPLSQNVSMSDIKDTNRERVEKCLRDSGFGEKMDSLKKGIDTEIFKYLYEDGIDLSGGERQKVGFARALYKGAPMIILDEPTSALDALAEYKLYMDFNALVGERTAVYISHRLSSTRFCDRVAMFEDGEMAEIGTHRELMEANGKYANLFCVQAQYYQDEKTEMVVG